MEDSITSITSPPSPLSLPNDPQALRAMVLALSRQRDDATSERDDWKQQHDCKARECDQWHIKFLAAEMDLLRLRKQYYGRKADRMTTSADAAQLVLEFTQRLEALPVPEVEDVEAVTEDPQPIDLGQVELTEVRKVRRGRRNLAVFDQLPVVRKEHDLSEQQKACPCCGESRTRMGQETSWQIEYIPGRFERIEHVRMKYACQACNSGSCPVCDGAGHIEKADKPQQPIDKGMPGPGLLAYVVTSKYADYLPLYRLESIFERNGLSISRATQSVWCRDVADLLRPLFDLMNRRLLQSRVICTDDTVMPMLWPGHGQTKTARMWVYVGDEANPYNLFDFTLGRGRDGPAAFLREYHHTLVADAYGGYDGVVVGNDITRAGCWAHARRKFVEAEKSHPAIAAEAVGWIGQLYAVESAAKGSNDAERLCLRQSQTQAILDRLRDRLWGWKDQLLPKHPMALAINYALNQWKTLTVYAGDGGVPIDNNISERQMKRVVLNRKNSLFVGNERGGRTAAILSSLTSTCRRHEIDPQRYLTQVLMNLPGMPMSELEQWLPDRWKQIQGEVVL